MFHVSLATHVLRSFFIQNVVMTAKRFSFQFLEMGILQTYKCADIIIES